MNFLPSVLISVFLLFSCENGEDKKVEFTSEFQQEIEDIQIINEIGSKISDRFNCPKNYKRINYNSNSFGNYLRNIPLKESSALVKYYNGSYKPNNGIYHAVVDLEIGDKNLHQCADAIMRLRADYFYEKGEYDKIHFNFTNGFRVDYSKWIQGNRIKIQGNKSWWVSSAKPDSSYKTYWKYLETIFTYAGSLSLEKELNEIKLEEMRIGDVFIQGGSPGHAVIVVDMAENKSNGKKLFILAQSYMPAQEIQILTNPNNPDLSPWYELDLGNEVWTPEWTFSKYNLKRF
jgi:hypothetical protein